MISKFNFIACLGLFLHASVLAENISHGGQKEPTQYISIPGISLQDALLAIGAQYDVGLIVSADKISLYTSSPVVGYFSLAQAIETVLSGTPFSFVFDNKLNAVMLVSKPDTKEIPEPENEDDITDTFEEVLVSARRRDEILHDVPMAINIFSEEMMASRGLSNLINIGAYVPNATIKRTRGTNGTLSAYIRGIGQEDPAAGFEAGVGVYVDDVYISRPQGILLDIFDMDRIEVLRGPQGTLYGRNTIGGAIKFVTRPISDNIEGEVKLSVGQYNQRDIVASGAMPVPQWNAKLGASIAVLNRDGFGENLFTGEQNYNKEIVATRINSEFSITETMALKLSGDYFDDTSNHKSGYRMLREEGEFALSNRYDTHSGISLFPHPIDKNFSHARGVSANFRWTVTPSFNFESVISLRKDKTESLIDFEALPENIQDGRVRYMNEQLTQEYRFLLEKGRYTLLTGVYFLDANASQISDVAYVRLGGTRFRSGDFDTKSWALYSSVDKRIGDTVELSLGARYTYEDRKATIDNQIYLPSSNGDLVSPPFGGDGLGLIGEAYDEQGNLVAPRFKGARSDSKLTTRFSASWKPHKDMHLYGSYSEGYKGGGFNPRGYFVLDLDRHGFDPETIDTYEVGLKSKLFDDRVSSHLAAFYSDYQNIQTLGGDVFDVDGDGISDGFFHTVTNDTTAVIHGVEIDATLSLSENLESQFSAGLLSAEYKKLIEQGRDMSGERVMPNTPEKTASLSFSYNLESPLWHELTFVGAIQYRGFTAHSATLNPLQDQSGYSAVNASVFWRSKGQRWEVSLHGYNLADKAYKEAGFHFPVHNVSTVFYGEPRRAVATFKYLYH